PSSRSSTGNDVHRLAVENRGYFLPVGIPVVLTDTGGDDAYPCDAHDGLDELQVMRQYLGVHVQPRAVRSLVQVFNVLGDVSRKVVTWPLGVVVLLCCCGVVKEHVRSGWERPGPVTFQYLSGIVARRPLNIRRNDLDVEDALLGVGLLQHHPAGFPQSYFAHLASFPLSWYVPSIA